MKWYHWWLVSVMWLALAAVNAAKHWYGGVAVCVLTAGCYGLLGVFQRRGEKKGTLKQETMSRLSACISVLTGLLLAAAVLFLRR
jgi:hypothetical protein